MKDNKIVVLIPSLNPNKEFVDYVKDLTNQKEDIDVIVVDDGSKESKKFIFEKISKLKNCIVLTHAINLGKGRALKTGFNYFINNYKGCKGIITADSDGQHLVEDVISIGKELNEVNGENLILGTRDFNEPQVPFKSRNGNKITTQVFKLLYGKKINDTQTGLRGLSYEFAKECINLDGEKFDYEINMLIEAVKKKINIIEHKIKTVYFNNNSETHFNPIKDSIKIYKIMFKKFFKFILSSASSAVLDIGLFTILYYFINLKLKSTTSILISTVLARMCSSIYNYFINKNVVFKDNKSNITIIKYYILCVIQTLISYLGVKYIFVFLEVIPPSIIKIFVDVILFLISYQIQQKWVFASKKVEK